MRRVPAIRGAMLIHLEEQMPYGDALWRCSVVESGAAMTPPQAGANASQ